MNMNWTMLMTIHDHRSLPIAIQQLQPLLYQLLPQHLVMSALMRRVSKLHYCVIMQRFVSHVDTCVENNSHCPVCRGVISSTIRFRNETIAAFIPYLCVPYLCFPPFQIRTCDFRTCVFHPCTSVLACSILAFSILVKCPDLYLGFPYLCFLILAISAPPCHHMSLITSQLSRQSCDTCRFCLNTLKVNFSSHKCGSETVTRCKSNSRYHLKVKGQVHQAHKAATDVSSLVKSWS